MYYRVVRMDWNYTPLRVLGGRWEGDSSAMSIVYRILEQCMEL